MRRGGVLILGAGGHGKVVADILLCQGVPVLGFLDDDPMLEGHARLGLPIVGRIDAYPCYEPSGLVLGIGDTAQRRWVVRRCGAEAQPLWRNAIHPRAIVAASARLGQGVTISAGAVVNPDASLDDHTIVNTGATVDHDCVVAAYGHIAPGASLAGGVRIGEGVLIGVGANICPNCSIGDWAVVGAGATVVRDIPAGVTAVGVPARYTLEAPRQAPPLSRVRERGRG
ncbi:MAG: acetyltransferase [Chloroflexota bacterium]|nr:acetyltransferase [Chloroflexota bacterium]